MNKLTPILKKLRNEWEALVLATLMIALLVLSISALGRLFSPKTPELSSGGSTRINLAFAPDSFSFLNPQQEPPSLGMNHAFYTIPPPKWKPPTPRTPTATDKEPPKSTDSTANPDKGPEIFGPEEPPIAEVVTPEPPPQKPDVPEKPPEPKPRDFLTYNGFMSTPSGDDMAMVTHEHQPGRGDRTRKSSFIQSGEELLGLRIDDVRPDLLILVGQDGEEVKIRKGRRVRLKQAED